MQVRTQVYITFHSFASNVANSLAHSFVCFSVRTFICLFVPLVVHLFVHSNNVYLLDPSLYRLLVCSFTCSFVRSCVQITAVRLLVESYISSFVCSLSFKLHLKMVVLNFSRCIT